MRDHGQLTPPGPLPSLLVQHELFEMVLELVRLDWRLSVLERAVDLPADHGTLYGGKARQTLETEIHGAIRNARDPMVNEAIRMLRRAATLKAGSFEPRRPC